MTPAASSWCVVRLGSDLYALDVAVVGEVLPASSPVPLPRCPAGVLGLISRRGQPLAVVDPWLLLDLSRPVGAPPAQLLVLRTATTLAALPVDACAGVVAAPPGTFRPVARSGEPPWVAGFQPLTSGEVATVIATAELLRRLDRLRFAAAA